MRRLAMLGAFLVIGAAALSPAGARPLCLTPRQIDHTTVVSPRTILFHMKDGKIWRSDLRTPCLGLKFYGFRYETAIDEICSGSQAIQVLRTHEVCVLGPFQPQTIGHD